MKKYIYNFIKLCPYHLSFIYLIILVCTISCDKEDIDPNFLINDYNPDIVITIDDTVFFDINKDYTNDFKAFHAKASGFTYLIFESVSDNCFLSDGISNPNRKYILYNDTISDNLTWNNKITWVISSDDSENGIAYLAIKIANNLGWLLPTVEGINSSNHYLIISKSTYCKVNNKNIIAGLEKIVN